MKKTSDLVLLSEYAIILPEVMVGALFFSFLAGIVAGYVPAQRAAKLDAVDSLRFE